jgi:hypothetical protein
MADILAATRSSGFETELIGAGGSTGAHDNGRER